MCLPAHVRPLCTGPVHLSAAECNNIKLHFSSLAGTAVAAVSSMVGPIVAVISKISSLCSPLCASGALSGGVLVKFLTLPPDLLVFHSGLALTSG
jgi:hypothetical protein